MLLMMVVVLALTMGSGSGPQQEQDRPITSESAPNSYINYLTYHCSICEQSRRYQHWRGV